MTAPPWSEMIAAHYRLQAALYMPRRETVVSPAGVEGSIHWHPELGDPEWNHAYLPDDPSIDRAGLAAFMRLAGARLQELGRQPVVVLAPSMLPRLKEALRSSGAVPCFHHRWACWPEEAPSPVLDPAVRFQQVETPAVLESFLHIFFEAFAPAATALFDPEAGFEKGWRRSLEGSVRQRGGEELEIRHYLATWRDEPAGIMTLGLAGRCAGFYNLAVRPRFRRRGLGASLQAFRIRQARQAGARFIFLQTDEPSVAGWNRRHGWVDGPQLVGWRVPSVGIAQSAEAGGGGSCAKR